RASDLLRAKDPKRRIDIIYICSNSGIARQNVKRLNITGRPTHDLPDRITLLPRDIGRLRANSVNFIAFTPGTSLNLKSSGGRADERALLVGLLPEAWLKNEKGSISLLTGEMERERFKRRIDERWKVDDGLRTAFRASLEADPVVPGQAEKSLREHFMTLADQLGGRVRLTDDE